MDASTLAGRRVRAQVRRRLLAAARLEPLLAVGLTLLFLAVTAWWLKHDSRVPDFDNGKHLGNSLFYYDQFKLGILEPFKVFTDYPPLVHVVGALGAWVGGVGVRGPIMVENLVFVPLLVIGCYGTGVVATGGRRLAGLLAAVFALGTPMLVSQLHVMMLDAPLAAMVAMTVWLLLASDRFSRPGVAAAAGACAGLGLLAKQTFPFFVAGLLLVMLARGGWRNWRGLVLFLALAAVVAGPWYLEHAGDLRSLSQGAVTFSTPDAAGSDHGGAYYNPDSPTPPRWSLQNVTWYVWGALNHQLLLPLSLLFAGGIAAGALGYARKRRRDDLVPELLGGALVSYLGMTIVISLHDVRYTLPGLVYMAVIGTRWIALAARPWRMAGVAAVGLVAAVNFATVSFGLGHEVRYKLPGALESGLGRRQVTLYSPNGYIVGGPQRGGRVLDLMLAAKADGKRFVGFHAGGAPFFNSSGLTVFAYIAAFPEVSTLDPHDLLVRPGGFFLVNEKIGPGWLDPCSKLADGTGVFGLLPDPGKPLEAWPHYCPPAAGRA